MTTSGLISAIHRILEVISGHEELRSAGLYAQLEEILEQPILATLRDPFGESTQTGIECLMYLQAN